MRSRGSHTSEWLRRSFQRPLNNVVYVSANPQISMLDEVRKNFKRVIDLYLLCWDDKLQTVKPSAVNLFVKENIIVGKKKLIAHYMQPHPPFLANTWLNIYSHDFRRDKKGLEIYDLAMKNSETRKEFVKAYIKSLVIVVKYVEILVNKLRTIEENLEVVITSDHSEILHGSYYPFRFTKKFWLWIPWMLGIYRFVGHEEKSKLPPRARAQLYEVPWIEL